ncbi:Repair protein [Xylophilus ampelinus]|nr:Repair protein [Xylophilus ampelinus]
MPRTSLPVSACAAWMRRCGPLFLLGLAALIVFSPPARAELLEVPAFSSRVVDRTDTLSEDDAQALRARIAEVEAATQAQLAVLIVSSTHEEDIAPFALRVFEAWKPGDAARDDGLLVVVALADRRMRIEVGQGLEGTVPDVAAARIVDRVMAPRFREGDYAGGLRGAVDALDQRLRGHAPADADEDADAPMRLTPEGMAFIAVLAWSLLVGVWHARRKPRWRVTSAATAVGPLVGGAATAHLGVAIGGLMIAPVFVVLGWILGVSRTARWVALGLAGLIAALISWGRVAGGEAVLEGLLFLGIGGFALGLVATTLFMMIKAWRGSRKGFALRLLAALLLTGVGLWHLHDSGAMAAHPGVLEAVVVLVSFLIAFVVAAGNGWSIGSGGGDDDDRSSSSSSSGSSSSGGGGGSSSGGGASGSW